LIFYKIGHIILDRICSDDLQVASANNRNSLTDAMAMGLIRLLSIAFTLVLLSILPLHLSLAGEFPFPG